MTTARALLDHSISEKDFAQQVVDLAVLKGWLVYHTYDSQRSNPGFPDLILAKEGKVLAAELKREAGVVTTEQHVWLDLLKSAGIPTFIWRPHDWETIVEMLT